MPTSYQYIFNEDLLLNDINKHFQFLVSDQRFTKIPEYQYVREVHNDFIKDKLIIKIVYDGGFWLDILTTKKPVPELLSQIKKTVDYEFSFFKSYNLKNLDPNQEIYNSVSSKNFPDKDLWYYAKLLKQNPDILEGNLTKLKLRYRILKHIGLKK